MTLRGQDPSCLGPQVAASLCDVAHAHFDKDATSNVRRISREIQLCRTALVLVVYSAFFSLVTRGQKI